MTVRGYEFPNEEIGPTEDNPADCFDTGRYLIVAIQFSNSQHTWSASGPIMCTDELDRLINWLASIADDPCSANGVYFTERDLEFSFDRTHSHLLVHIFRDFLPSWCDANSLTLAFPKSEIDFPSVVRELRAQRGQFPGRPPLETSM